MKRFKYAFQGIRALLIKDRHFLIHFIIALIVILFGFIFNLNIFEWLFIISAVFFVLVSEIMNTSIEYTVDLSTGDYHILAKYAKDTSALAVLFASLYAVIVGLIIFLPRLIELFS